MSAREEMQRYTKERISEELCGREGRKSEESGGMRSSGRIKKFKIGYTSRSKVQKEMRVRNEEKGREEDRKHL